jgi:hypothetical protein
LRDAVALSGHSTAETALRYFQPGAAAAIGVEKLLANVSLPAVKIERKSR